MDHAVLSYDAVHAASAVALDAGAIAALDGDFAHLPEQVLSILTVQARVTALRDIRL